MLQPPVPGTGGSRRREPVTWNVVAGMGYSFLLMLGAAAFQLVIEVFLPRPTFGIYLSPLYAFASGRVVSGLADTLLYSLVVLYNSKWSSRTREERYTSTLSAWCTLSLIFVTVLFDATAGYPVQTRLGAFVLAGALSGLIGGLISAARSFHPMPS